MKTVRIHEFGGPEVMKLEDVARPVPARDEILVKVYASGANSTNWVNHTGGNHLLRPLQKPPLILVWD